MSSVQASDIIEALKVIHSICSVWYHKDLRADAQYLAFLDDVRRFGEVLERLDEILAQAKASEIASSPINGTTSSKSLSRGTYRERKEVIGDFLRTLRQCEKLLDDNQKFLTNSPTFLENVHWHFSTQERANGLRSRLNAHYVKISLILETLNSAKLADIKGDIERVLDRLSLDVRLPSVPASLEERYMEALQDGRPPTFTTLGNFPLKEGLDALVFHFNQSTIKFTKIKILGVFQPGSDHFNNLIKSRWIFGRLLESSQLREEGPSSLWNIALISILKRIAYEYEQWAEELPLAEQQINMLGREYFAIWLPREAPTPGRIPTEEDKDKKETKMLECGLREPNEHQTKDLHVFRRPNNVLRLLLRDTVKPFSTADEGSAVFSKKIISLKDYYFLPHYAFPGNSRRKVDISGDTYEFNSDEDVHNFQWILTSYKVNYDTPDVQVKIHTSSFFGLRTKLIEGVARIQIWQPEHKLPASFLGDPLWNAASRKDSRSAVSPTATARLGRSTTTSTIDTCQGFPTSASVQPSPVLMLFTTWEHRKSLLHLRLESEIKIAERCDCSSEDPSLSTSCKRVILEYKPPSRSKFRIRCQSEETDRHGELMPSTCNLALFGLGYPDFEAHHRLGAVDAIENVQWLCLSFSSASQRMAFTKAFVQQCETRNNHQLAFEKGATAARHRAAKPNHTASTSRNSTQAKYRSSGSGSTFSYISTSSIRTRTSTAQGVSSQESPKAVEAMAARRDSVSTAGRDSVFTAAT